MCAAVASRVGLFNYLMIVCVNVDHCKGIMYHSFCDLVNVQCLACVCAGGDSFVCMYVCVLSCMCVLICVLCVIVYCRYVCEKLHCKCARKRESKHTHRERETEREKAYILEWANIDWMTICMI